MEKLNTQIRFTEIATHAAMDAGLSTFRLVLPETMPHPTTGDLVVFSNAPDAPVFFVAERAFIIVPDQTIQLDLVLDIARQAKTQEQSPPDPSTAG